MENILVTVEVSAGVDGELKVTCVEMGQVVEKDESYHFVGTNTSIQKIGVHRVSRWDTSYFSNLKAHCFEDEKEEWKEKLTTELKKELEVELAITQAKLKSFR